MLVLSRKPSEELVLQIGPHCVTIRVLTACNGRVRIGIDAPRNIEVLRQELKRSHKPEPIQREVDLQHPSVG